MLKVLTAADFCVYASIFNFVKTINFMNDISDKAIFNIIAYIKSYLPHLLQIGKYSFLVACK